MPIGDVETYYQDGAWHNKREVVQTTPATSHETKAEAVAKGRDLATFLAARQDFQPGRHNVEHIVRNEDGTIGGRTPARDRPVGRMRAGLRLR